MTHIKRLTRARFDGLPKPIMIAVLGSILASAILMTLDSVPAIHNRYALWINAAEIALSILFAMEYVYRIINAKSKLRYVFSFWGIIDLLSILPLSVMIDSANPLRVLRLMRFATIFKLMRIGNAHKRLKRAFSEVKEEMLVFAIMALFAIFMSAVGIYYFEHDAQPDTFSSIPACMWWAVITFTTVGYGDMFPITAGGKVFTALILMGGLALVAVPTGIFSTALLSISKKGEMDQKEPKFDN